MSMNKYLENLNETIKSYFKILSNEFPEFLLAYINTPVMQKQSKISVSCGTYYSKMYNQMWYSSLDHSIAVALIIWNFTKDKIKVEEVCNYHVYPIADNDTPMLSSDRLEYTLSNGLGATEKLWNLKEIEKIYKNIEIQNNENGIIELGFKDKEIAEQFVHTMSQLSCLYRRDETIFSMQFLADIIKKMSDKSVITLEDLYNLSEKEIIEKIENCTENNISQCFKIWKEATNINTSNICPENVYYVNIEKNKVRYINPLVRDNEKYVRLANISEVAKRDIQNTFAYKNSKYIYMNFRF